MSGFSADPGSVAETADRRGELLAALNEAFREQASRTVMMHQAIAERFGLNSTDIKCLDLARNETALTAGRLAEITGMSTSAITAVLDRLEGRQFIERRRDPADRRKVIVVATGKHETQTLHIFARVQETFERFLDSYDDAQLEFLLNFTERLNATARDLTTALTTDS